MRASVQIGLLALAASAFGVATSLRARGDAPSPSSTPPATHRTIGPDGMGEIELPPPPLTDGVFPCNDCHEGREPDTSRREIAEHDFKFEHDAEHRWCFDCHDIENYDKLKLASGEAIDFAESFKLCGQCHGDKYRDWRAGVHGRRTGEWSSGGHKTYLLCVHCHNPHSPRFKPIKPLPPPVRPERLRGGR